MIYKPAWKSHSARPDLNMRHIRDYFAATDISDKRLIYNEICSQDDREVIAEYMTCEPPDWPCMKPECPKRCLTVQHA